MIKCLNPRLRHLTEHAIVSVIWQNMQSFPYLAEHSIVSVFGRTFNRDIVVERLESKRHFHLFLSTWIIFVYITMDSPEACLRILFETVQRTNQTFFIFIFLKATCNGTGCY